MKFILFQVTAIICVITNFAIANPPKIRLGLLTNSYGIVTDADLNEEELKATPEPFPPDLPSFNYWQCLKPEGYFLGCEDEGTAVGEGWEIGSATFWIKADGKKYDFGTRRNWDIRFCRDMISNILKIVEGQSVVCIAASYLGADTQGSRWIVDRVKTKRGGWSWFAR